MRAEYAGPAQVRHSRGAVRNTCGPRSDRKHQDHADAIFVALAQVVCGPVEKTDDQPGAGRRGCSRFKPSHPFLVLGDNGLALPEVGLDPVRLRSFRIIAEPLQKMVGGLLAPVHVKRTVSKGKNAFVPDFPVLEHGERSENIVGQDIYRMP